jgi:putative transposase
VPRKPRLHVPGGLYHVILRGNGRQAIFFDDDDRRRWESLIEEGLERYGHRLHAYCWMTNHVHMAIQCDNDPLANFMRFVASGYARSTNKKLNRSGHLFERRHRAILVDADRYSMQLIRYIHRNPLRARLVEVLSEYHWSSHPAYQTGKGPGWLTLEWALRMFGSTTGSARRQYRRFMALEDSPCLARGFNAGGTDDGRVFGSDDFAASVGCANTRSGSSRTLTELVTDVCRKHGVDIADLRSPSREHRLARIRAEIGILAVDDGIATNAELARFFDRSQAAISRAAGRLRRRLKK